MLSVVYSCMMTMSAMTDNRIKFQEFAKNIRELDLSLGGTPNNRGPLRNELKAIPELLIFKKLELLIDRRTPGSFTLLIHNYNLSQLS